MKTHIDAPMEFMEEALILTFFHVLGVLSNGLHQFQTFLDASCRWFP